MTDINNQLKAINSIICLNGEIPNKHFFRRHHNLPIIAADGAANTLLKMGIEPTLIVGDLDSIDINIVPSYIKVLHIEDQDSTDLQKCLEVLTARNLFPCLIYGATGKESDHTLYNLNIIANHSLHNSIIFHDSACKEKEKYGFFVHNYLSGDLKIGSKISLLSFTKSRVTTKGLVWELNNMELSPETSSIRNTTISTNFEITVHNGNVLVLFDLDRD